MDYDEVVELLNYINLNYPNFVVNATVTKAWLDELQQYDLNDVKENLKRFMGEEAYQYVPPKVSLLIRGLTKKHEKIDFNRIVYFCDICHRKFNDKEEMDKHFDRCSSVRYLLKQFKRFNLTNMPSKKQLYEMDDEDFNIKYKKFLRLVQENTKSESEKQRIEFIFNPPSKQYAKNFLGGTSEA